MNILVATFTVVATADNLQRHHFQLLINIPTAIKEPASPRPFIMQGFSRFKNGPFHRRQKNITLCDSKWSSFIAYFFELQFDTATLIIPRFRMTQARGANRGSNLIYYVITWYLIPGRIYMQHYYTEI